MSPDFSNKPTNPAAICLRPEGVFWGAEVEQSPN